MAFCNHPELFRNGHLPVRSRFARIAGRRGKVVGDAVTVAASRKSGQDGFRMGLAMTIAARLDPFMPLGMALGTGEIPVLGGGDRQEPERLGVAAAAVLGWRLRAVPDGKGRVGGMTGLADLLFLAGTVGCMAPEALGNLPVPGMAGRTGQLPVKTRRRFHLLAELRMARQAGPGEIPAQSQIEGGVRVPMAMETILPLEMGLARMALDAVGNDVELRGRMPLVAIEARHFRGVGFPGPGEPAGHPRMALVAVGHGEDRRRSFFADGSRGWSRHGQKEYQPGSSEKGRPHF